MSDHFEREQHRYVADQLGLTIDELDQTDYEIEVKSSSDDLVYSWIINFGESSPKGVLGKISQLVHGRWIEIPPMPDGPDGPEDE